MSQATDDKVTLYVGNLDPEVNEVLLYELFLQFAPVKTIKLLRDSLTGAHRGFGFVTFYNVKDSLYAQQLCDGLNFFNRTMKVKMTIDDTSGGSKLSEDFGPILSVHNLNSMADQQTLIQVFSTFGKLAKLPIITKPTGPSDPTHAIIQYQDFESADKAIEQMNGKLILNLPVTIKYAPKKDSKTGKHGDEVERLIYQKAIENNALPQFDDINLALLTNMNKQNNKNSTPSSFEDGGKSFSTPRREPHENSGGYQSSRGYGRGGNYNNGRGRNRGGFKSNNGGSNQRSDFDGESQRSNRPNNVGGRYNNSSNNNQQGSYRSGYHNNHQQWQRQQRSTDQYY